MPAALQLPPREEVALPDALRAAVAAALDVDELREPAGVAAGDDKAAAVADAARKAWSSLAFRRGLRDFLNSLVSLRLCWTVVDMFCVLVRCLVRLRLCSVPGYVECLNGLARLRRTALECFACR
jgi:hypothetical protein